jgi:hypothetical protein
VAVYAYSAVTDPATRVASSRYVKQASPDPDGLWWASRGVMFGRETAPAMVPQDEQQALWSFATEVPLDPDDLIVADGQRWRVASVMLRTTFRSQVQAYCVAVNRGEELLLEGDG